MCSDYYIEPHRRKPFKETPKTSLSNDFQPPTPSNGFLQDYEIVSNTIVDATDEDDDDDEEEDTFVVAYDKVLTDDNDLEYDGQASALPQSPSEEFMKHLLRASNLQSNQKLSLALSTEKISLKSASTKTSKSIEHSPVGFTVVPINFRASQSKHEHPNDTAPYPEIVLKSFSATAQATGIPRLGNNNNNNNNNNRRKPSAKVTFQTQQTTLTLVEPEPKVIDTPDIDSIDNLGLTSSSSTQRNYEINEEQLKLPAMDENISNSSELVSQFDSSTSPESLMDNILSAASSVSVRSSSLSSSNTASHQHDMEEAAGRSLIKNVLANDMGPVNRPTLSMTTKSLEKKAFEEAQSSVVQGAPLTLGSITPLTPTPSQTAPPPPPSTQQQHTLQPPQLLCDTGSSNRSRSPSPSPSIVIRLLGEDSAAPPQSTIPDDLKCRLCAEMYRDPRTLNCLHSFCFQCLVDEHFKQDQSIPFWSQPSEPEINWKAGSSKSTGRSGRSASPELSIHSGSDSSTQQHSHSPLRRRGSSFSFRRKKSQDRILLKGKPIEVLRSSENSPTSQLRLATPPTEERCRVIACKICQYQTDLPIGGIRQLPHNFLLVRKIEQYKVQSGDEVIANVWCSLCFEETNATYHCIACTLNLCSLCKDAHERQRSTANHKIKNIMELRRAKKQKQNMLDDISKFTLKCGMHPGFEMKAFCNNCLEVACPDCLVLLHKGHKYEPINRAIGTYGKILKESIEQTRPLCNYAEHSIDRLNSIAKGIKRKCDEIQTDVESFLVQYFEALEVHKRTLLQQIARARESKVEMILEQQLDLEKRNNEAVEALRFSQELSDTGSDVEILSFLSILLKRFEYCQQFKAPVDPKISDSLHFLPDIRAPSNKNQNHIPLYGIITMQTVEPSLCTLQIEGSSHLRLHKRVEFIMESRDSDGASLCHGGLRIKALLKYKESNSKFLPIEVSDHRDGTYGIAFTPDSQGTIILTIHINERPIQGSPFTLQARMVRPHNGIFHCCAFCSSKGNKLVSCSCNGRMAGYKGCGHGHPGHPGRRHWSCCGNVLENSECNVANKLLNPENTKV